ncbi:hypothetical protein CVS30_06270 [Arthrobacter psychrolactophilus]|uniref:Uncharacterized protein n=1 Tax=Arthrobacter psychrolactophilus TaxID=92442 RepID=A0A2V5IQT8_9MICC|nr:hypothetical protein [Arthrobacter psychrolactophilus]PYI38918.1 hypothetical protein CVS30_06270 [Arthrobacter psychrolactophilus]
MSISATNLEDELTFFDPGNTDDALFGISNALHSIGFLLVSPWSAMGPDFHAFAMEVELTVSPEWAASTRGVSNRSWSNSFHEETNGAASRIHELDLLPWSESHDSTVTVTQIDVFQRGTVQRGAIRLTVEIDETNISAIRAAELAAALQTAGEIVARSNAIPSQDRTPESGN